MEASALSHPVGLGRVSLAGPLLRLRTDDQLVALFRAGHDEAFGQIHDRYRARLFAYCRQMLGGSRGDAEDVLQDVFLRAYNSLRADRRDVALRAWLYRVAHNRCIDHLRRPTPAAEDIFDVNRGSAQERPEDAVERREDLRRLIADVRALPEQQRSALLMREMEGLSYNDLAAALGVTVPAIKSLLVRARIGLVEAVEARDTACVEIRDDLDSAFGRGVRVSGRARKHLKECAGCRDYRGALRGVEKQLNGLAPSHGPLGLVAKLLGIGGAGSGGGAAVFGGGGAATATVTTGTAATVGTSAVATKVVAVVAAAAVVGGGAATVQKVEHAVKKPVAHERVVAKPAAGSASVGAAVAERAAKTAAVSASSSTAGATKRSLSHTGGLRPASHRGGGATATKLSTSATASAEAAPKLEPGSGGLEAPSDAATSTPVDPGGSGTATSGTAQGATTGAGSTATAGTGAGDGTAAGSATTASGSDTGSAGTSGTSTTTTSSSSSSSASTGGAATAPSGAVSQGATAPVAQGATATPAP